jgi:hypothetical protein
MDGPYLENLPDLRNRPPRILEETVDPPERKQTLSVGSCLVQFRATIEDPDASDEIYVHWFVNNVLKKSELIRADPERKTLRDTPASYALDSTNPGNPLEAENVVELVVADGVLLIPQRVLQPRSQLPDGGAGQVSYADSYSWFLVHPAGACQ